MTQEEKQLLFKDLCARLSHGVVYHRNDGANIKLSAIDVERGLLNYTDDIEERECKPYLRPMSSMTEEEREEWADLFNLELDKLNEIDDENEAEELAPYYFGKSHQVSIDWLNEHYFDYRGLIEKGLALEAPKDMYGIQN